MGVLKLGWQKFFAPGCFEIGFTKNFSHLGAAFLCNKKKGN